LRGSAAEGKGAEGDFAVSEAGSAILGQLANLIGVRHRRDEIDRAIVALAETFPRINATADHLLFELARGLKRAGARLEFAGVSVEAGDWLKSKLSAATAAVTAEPGSKVHEAQRIPALELVSAAYLPGTRELLLGLIRLDQSDALQIAAIRGLSNDTE